MVQSVLAHVTYGVGVSAVLIVYCRRLPWFSDYLSYFHIHFHSVASFNFSQAISHTLLLLVMLLP